MEEVAKMVYENLMRQTDEVGALVAQHDVIDEKIRSGKYSVDYITGNLSPADKDVKMKIRQAKTKAISDAMELVEAYQNTLREADDLKPSDITDDAKLFTVGVKLTARDLEAILSRNKENATMIQLTLRYAEENGIKLEHSAYVGRYAQKIKDVEGLKTVIEYYADWIDKKDAKNVLNKFFNIPD